MMNVLSVMRLGGSSLTTSWGQRVHKPKNNNLFKFWSQWNEKDIAPDLNLLPHKHEASIKPVN